MTIQARTLYTSPKGDTWSLCRNRNGEVVITTQPDPAAGGEQSEVDLSSFLAKGNQRPEHQALRKLIGEMIEPSHIQAAYDDHD